MRSPVRIAVALILAGCSDARPSPSPAFSAPTPSAIAAPALPRSVTPAPPLPRGLDAVRALVEQRTARREAEIEHGAEAIAAAAAGAAPAAAGERAITLRLQAWLDDAAASGSDAYLLIGTYHDAAGQIDAFRRLVGPGGIRGLTRIAIEQLRAGGRWGGAPIDAQRGDDEAIAAYVERGDRAAFDALARGHRDVDYAAWKFGYEASVLELLATARATGTPLSGCDMPAPLQRLADLPPGPERSRLREIHCLLSIEASPGPRRVAMLWGQAHARPGALRRFLPAEARALSVHVFGHRTGSWTIEATLARSLVVVDPVLVPLPGPDEAALLLPDATLGGEVDRARSPLGAGELGESGVHVRAEAAGKLEVGDRSIATGPTGAFAPLPPGDHGYAFTAGPLRFLGSLRVPRGGRVELAFDPARRAVTYLERAPPDEGSP
jgi:hypothetical protein